MASLVRQPRTAVVHDWLVTWRGGENVLAEILEMIPDADLFTLVDFLPDSLRAPLAGRPVRTSFLQKVPLAATRFRWLLPAFPNAIEALDLSAYDRIVSISHAVAKNVRVRPGQQHLCYCLTPMRYAWDMRDDYLASVAPARGARRWLAGKLLDHLREWDRQASERVTRFAGISRYVAARIDRAYGRAARVIYPPVDVNYFRPAAGKSATPGYFITGGQWVPYKKVDAVVGAFRLLRHLRLIVTGEGPESTRVRAAAGPNVEFVGHLGREQLRTLLQGARAFVFNAEEDFGILPVEAQACGIPVVALGRGGTAETIVGAGDRATGILFDAQDASTIASAITRFEQNEHRIDAGACRAQALKFGSERFRRELMDWLGQSPSAVTAGPM